MQSIRLALAIVSLAIAPAASLVPLPASNVTLPVYGLEVNRGQAKPAILFVAAGAQLAVTSQSVLISPLGLAQNLVSGNPTPAVRYLDPLPGVANVYTGNDPSKWVTGIPRYKTAHLSDVYPGIDVEYVIAESGRLLVRFLVRPGVDPQTIVWDIPSVYSLYVNSTGDLIISAAFRLPALTYPAPTAFEDTASGPVARSVNYEVLSTTKFGLHVSGQSGTSPLRIEMQITAQPFSANKNPAELADELKDTGDIPASPAEIPVGLPSDLLRRPVMGFKIAASAKVNALSPVVDTGGNVFAVATIGDAAGKDAPFPNAQFPGFQRDGCGSTAGVPNVCNDVAVYKFTQTGSLAFVSYFAGRTQEQGSFVGISPDGNIICTGTTNSSDFPVTVNGLQRNYAGPPATPRGFFEGGDFFIAKLDASRGTLIAATYFGGPEADNIGETAVAADGTIYLIPKWLIGANKGMPVSQGAIQSDCPSECTNGYAAHISAGLDGLLYGAYLPGTPTSTAHLHSDGSVYYAGWSGPGFPTTPGAFKSAPSGETDAVVARLDPSGSKLLFGTYIGGPFTDWILRMADAPDGSVWVSVSSFARCCIDIQSSLVHLDSNGSRVLTEKALTVSDVAVDRDGDLIALAAGNFSVNQDAFLANRCAPDGQAYLKLGPSGEQLFATYLPDNVYSDFSGVSSRGLPLVKIGAALYEIVEGQSMGIYAGCVVSAASFGNSDVVSPGEIISIFGSKLGPLAGQSFQPVNGRAPTSIGGTRVLVNGVPAPLLYASHWQVNAILPYSLPVNSTVAIEVEDASGMHTIARHARVQTAGIALFVSGGSSALRTPTNTLPAAALNEDGTVNSPANPAKPGSRVVLFGTGGGATVPPSVDGGIAPLMPQPLQNGVVVRTVAGQVLTVEYAGAAPGLVSGVTQINVKLPDVVAPTPPFPAGVLPLMVQTLGVTYDAGWMTIAVQ